MDDDYHIKKRGPTFKVRGTRAKGLRDRPFAFDCPGVRAYSQVGDWEFRIGPTQPFHTETTDSFLSLLKKLTLEPSD